jgi:hypothetical protein
LEFFGLIKIINIIGKMKIGALIIGLAGLATSFGW